MDNDITTFINQKHISKTMTEGAAIFWGATLINAIERPRQRGKLWNHQSCWVGKFVTTVKSQENLNGKHLQLLQYSKCLDMCDVGSNSLKGTDIRCIYMLLEMHIFAHIYIYIYIHILIYTYIYFHSYITWHFTMKWFFAETWRSCRYPKLLTFACHSQR